jgi:acetyltransferase-like isoleucine patch superfamily enzyme
MEKKSIHQTAIIEGELIAAEGCQIGINTILTGRVEIGKNVTIGNNSIIYGPVKIEHTTFIGDNVIIGYPLRDQISKYMETRDLRDLYMGDGCTIGSESVVRSGTIIYSNVKLGAQVKTGHNCLIREFTEIGNFTNIGTNTIIEGYSKIGSHISIQSSVFIPLYSTVEDDVFLGPNCKLTNDKYVNRKTYELKGPIIKKKASIGANAVIMPDITVGEGAIIGAGAVVTKNVPPNTIWVGVPAKLLKKVPDDWDKR